MAKKTTGTAIATPKAPKGKPGSSANASDNVGVSKNVAVKRDGFTVLNTVNVKPSKLVFRSQELQGRSTPLSEDDVIALADSIRVNSQQQPLQVRAIEGTDTYEILFGNTRGRAGLLIANGYTSPQRKDPYPANPDFTLRCEVVECSDEQAFVNNVVENAQRNACSPMDNARNQQYLREKLEMSDASIARLYGWSGSANVNRIKKLLSLPEYYQNLVHTGVMGFKAGVLLADAKDVVEKNAYDAVWAKAAGEHKDMEDDFTVGESQMADAIKEWRKEQKAANTPEGGEGGEGDGEGDDDEGESLILSRSKCYKLIEEIGGDARCPEKVAALCGKLLDAFDGKCGAKALTNAFLEATGEEALPAPAKDDKPAADAKPGKGKGNK